jgi:hypothetical protein
MCADATFFDAQLLPLLGRRRSASRTAGRRWPRGFAEDPSAYAGRSACASRSARVHTQLLLRTCLRSPSWDLRRHLTTGLSATTQDADRQRLPRGGSCDVYNPLATTRRVEIVLHIYNPLISVAGGGAACALQDFRRCRQQAVRSPPPAILGWRAPGNPPPPSAGTSTSARLEVATRAVAATAAELPALQRRHCEAAAVSISRQSALDL